MDSLRVWVVVLALVSFSAGGVGGQLLARQGAPAYADTGHFSTYRNQFVERFDLSPERERLLGELLANYEKEYEDIRQRALERSMADMEPELVSLGNRYSGIIRNNVLPPSQRALFVDHALAQPWTPVTEPRR